MKNFTISHIYTYFENPKHSGSARHSSSDFSKRAYNSTFKFILAATTMILLCTNLSDANAGDVKTSPLSKKTKRTAEPVVKIQLAGVVDQLKLDLNYLKTERRIRFLANQMHVSPDLITKTWAFESQAIYQRVNFVSDEIQNAGNKNGRASNSKTINPLLSEICSHLLAIEETLIHASYAASPENLESLVAEYMTAGPPPHMKIDDHHFAIFSLQNQIKSITDNPAIQEGKVRFRLQFNSLSRANWRNRLKHWTKGLQK